MKFEVLLIFLIVLASACQNSNTTHVSNTDPSLQLPEDFETFYNRFHEDTAFQMAHIVWPLPGRPSMLDSTSNYQGGAYQWEREDWVPHKPMAADSKFDREFELVSDFIINETFSHRDMPIRVHRRFGKTSDGWRLIFYAGPGN